MTTSEIQDYISDKPTFCTTHAIQPSFRPLEKEVIELFELGILPLLDSQPAQEHIWYTVWCIVERQSKKPVGDFCFYSPPQEDGWVECGYGVYPAFQNQGYMTEFLRGVLAWCQQFPALKTLRARTEPSNVPSNRMLERLNFELKSEDNEGNLFWEKRIRSSKAIIDPN